MRTILLYGLAAVCEIGGCYAFWRLLKQGQSMLGGAGSRGPSRVRRAADPGGRLAAGRTFAAYGGLYIAASLIWMRAVEGLRPDRWDLTGATVCLVGAGIILWAPRAA